jgi:hypothetical protein
MKKYNKKEVSYAIVFYSMLGMLICVLVMWWIEFLKQYPQIIF